MYTAFFDINLEAPEKNIVELANSLDPNEVAQNEPSHSGLCCLSSSFKF